MYVFKRGRDYYKYEYSTDTSISTEGWVFAFKSGMFSVSYALTFVRGWTVCFSNLKSIRACLFMLTSVNIIVETVETWPTCHLKHEDNTNGHGNAIMSCLCMGWKVNT